VQAPTHFRPARPRQQQNHQLPVQSSTNILIKDFKGQRVIVTGEESLDERWPNPRHRNRHHQTGGAGGAVAPQ